MMWAVTVQDAKFGPWLDMSMAGSQSKAILDEAVACLDEGFMLLERRNASRRTSLDVGYPLDRAKTA